MVFTHVSFFSFAHILASFSSTQVLRHMFVCALQFSLSMFLLFLHFFFFFLVLHDLLDPSIALVLFFRNKTRPPTLFMCCCLCLFLVPLVCLFFGVFFLFTLISISFSLKPHAVVLKEIIISCKKSSANNMRSASTNATKH